MRKTEQNVRDENDIAGKEGWVSRNSLPTEQGVREKRRARESDGKAALVVYNSAGQH